MSLNQQVGEDVVIIKQLQQMSAVEIFLAFSSLFIDPYSSTLWKSEAAAIE